MLIGYYPRWDSGFVLDYLDELKLDGQRKKAEARLRGDLLSLLYTWPRPIGVQVKPLKGHEPLWELKREYQGIAYRVFFCVNPNFSVGCVNRDGKEGSDFGTKK